MIKERPAKKAARLIRDYASQYYFYCLVFESRENMYAYHKLLHGRASERGPQRLPSKSGSLLDTHLEKYTHACAYVMPRRIIGSDNPTRKFFLGFVLLNRQDINAELITHEAVHIALEYLRRIRCSVKLGTQCDDNEEYLAYTVGIVATILANRMNEFKLWQTL